MDNKLLKQLGDLIDEKLTPIKKQLDIVEMKVEVVTERIELVSKKVEQSQEETIEAISELVTNGHNIHEKRIKRIEDHLQLP